MKRILLGLGLWFALCSGALAQNTTCATRPTGDSSNACASTAFVATGFIPGTNVPTHPVVHPSSGNLVGSGCIPSEAHSLWWLDQNLCSVSDAWAITSKDPSALFGATIGGTVTTGDTVSIKFTFASGLCSGVGCTVSYTTIGGDTVSIIAQKLSCAIANNASLFNLNGGTCTAGAVTPIASGVFGGYAGGQHIGYVVGSGAEVDLDFDSTIALAVTTTVSGAATETVTLQNSNCAVACSHPWDNNPVWNVVRNSTDGAGTAIAPPSGSQLWTVGSIAPNSSGANQTYGILQNLVDNSTVGSIHSKWLIIAPTTSGGFSGGGIYVGQGLYSTTLSDKGADSANFAQHWTAGVEQISRSGSIWLFAAQAGDSIKFTSNAGYGFGRTPSAAGVEAQTPISSFGTTAQPTTGQAWTVQGGSIPSSLCFDWGTSGYLPCVLLGTSFDFKPTNGTGGITVLANVTRPDTDNATTLGDGTHNWSTLFAKSISGLTTPLSQGQGGTGTATLGTGVATGLATAINTTNGFVGFNGNVGAALATSVIAANGPTSGFALKAPVGGAVDGQLVEGAGGNMFFIAPNDSGSACYPNCIAQITDHASNPVLQVINGSATPTLANDYVVNAATLDASSTTVASQVFSGGVAIAKKLYVGGITNVATTSALCYNTGTGLITYDGTLGTCTVSDERLKNIGPRIEHALDRLLQINGVHYTWKDTAYGSGSQIGVGAQTVEKVFPELVSTGSDGIKSVDYQRLTAPIIEAMRELKADNDNLQACLGSWKCRIFGIR